MILTKTQCIDYLWKAIVAYSLPTKRGWPPADRKIPIPSEGNWWNIGNAQGYYLVDEDKNGVILDLIDRGSDSGDDWKKNLTTFPFQLPSTAKDSKKHWDIHAGFCEVYLQKQALMHDIVRKIKPSRVITSGHSLGGATCQLTALDIKSVFPKIDVTCLPFAPPRLFKQETADQYDSVVNNTYGFYLHPDIIPVLPAEYGLVKGVEKLEPAELSSIWLDSPLGQFIGMVAVEKMHPHHPLRLVLAMEKWL